MAIKPERVGCCTEQAREQIAHFVFAQPVAKPFISGMGSNNIAAYNMQSHKTGKSRNRCPRWSARSEKLSQRQMMGNDTQTLRRQGEVIGH